MLSSGRRWCQVRGYCSYVRAQGCRKQWQTVQLAIRDPLVLYANLVEVVFPKIKKCTHRLRQRRTASRPYACVALWSPMLDTSLFKNGKCLIWSGSRCTYARCDAGETVSELKLSSRCINGRVGWSRTRTRVTPTITPAVCRHQVKQK